MFKLCNLRRSEEAGCVSGVSGAADNLKELLNAGGGVGLGICKVIVNAGIQGQTELSDDCGLLSVAQNQELEGTGVISLLNALGSEAVLDEELCRWRLRRPRLRCRRRELPYRCCRSRC